MGTSCELVVAATPEDEPHAQRALAAGLAEVETCERVLTRFDPTSDLSRLNAAAGAWVEVDSRLVASLRAAVRMRTATDGRFDPTILAPLLAAGYDRTFEELAHRRPRAVAGWRDGLSCQCLVERQHAVGKRHPDPERHGGCPGWHLHV